MISNSLLGPKSIVITTDREFKRAPSEFRDSVACLSWGQEENPNVLLCSTWDGFVGLYYVSPRHADAQITTVENIYQGRSTFMTNPCISLAWQSTEKKIIAGSINGELISLDSDISVSPDIRKQHDDAVKGVHYIPESNLICSLSYDKTMKFWDMRSPIPTASFNLGAKVVCSDMLFPHLAIGLSNEKLLILDLSDIHHVLRNVESHYIDSPLGSGSPLSAVSISKENTIGIGTYDGRSNLSKFERRSDGTTGLENIVTFKAHKIDPGQNGNTSDLKILYPIHAVGLHPTNRNTYFTAGGDGCVNFWDIPARNKLSYFTCTNTPITAAKYSPNGKLLAYAYGYDWARGIEGAQSIKPKLHVHSIQLDEVARV